MASRLGGRLIVWTISASSLKVLRAFSARTFLPTLTSSTLLLDARRDNLLPLT